MNSSLLCVVNQVNSAPFSLASSHLSLTALMDFSSLEFSGSWVDLKNWLDEFCLETFSNGCFYGKFDVLNHTKKTWFSEQISLLC